MWGLARVTVQRAPTVFGHHVDRWRGDKGYPVPRSERRDQSSGVYRCCWSWRFEAGFLSCSCLGPEFLLDPVFHCWFLFVLVGTPSILRPVQAVDAGNRGDQPRGDDDDRQTLAGCGGHFNIWTTDLLLPKSRVLFGIKSRLFSASV